MIHKPSLERLEERVQPNNFFSLIDGWLAAAIDSLPVEELPGPAYVERRGSRAGSDSRTLSQPLVTALNLTLFSDLTPARGENEPARRIDLAGTERTLGDTHPPDAIPLEATDLIPVVSLPSRPPTLATPPDKGAGLHPLTNGPTTPGSLDSSFNPTGAVPGLVLQFTTSQISLANNVGLQLQPDLTQKIVAAGRIGSNGAVARFNLDGSLDTTFGTNGTFTLTSSLVYGMVIQPDGKILVVNGSGGVNNSDFQIYRLNADGRSLDTSFGTNGKVLVDFTSSKNKSYDVPYSVTLQADGRIVVAGSSYVLSGNSPQDYRLTVARLNLNGSLDTSFGGTGKVITNLYPNPSSRDFEGIQSVAMQGDKIVVGGWSTPSSASVKESATFLRYNPNGSLDASFGTAGITRIDTTTTLEPDETADLAIDAQGRVVASLNAGGRFGVARLTANGVPDSTFTSASNPPGTPPGVVITEVGAAGGGTDFASGVAIQSDGKIVVAAYVDGGILTTPVRYNVGVTGQTDGSLDTTFGSGGIASYDFGAREYAIALAIQPDDGHIITAGTVQDSVTGQYQWALARINP